LGEKPAGTGALGPLRLTKIQPKHDPPGRYAPGGGPWPCVSGEENHNWGGGTILPGEGENTKPHHQKKKHKTIHRHPGGGGAVTGRADDAQGTPSACKRDQMYDALEVLASDVTGKTPPAITGGALLPSRAKRRQVAVKQTERGRAFAKVRPRGGLDR